MDQIASMFLPIGAVVAGRYLYEGIQVVGNFVKVSLSPQAHAAALVGVVFGLLQFGQFLGMSMPDALDNMFMEGAVAGVGAGVAMGWHSLSSKKG